jgi:light-regulated signal transduction histidine kinase (bacteriophytochrome)
VNHAVETIRPLGESLGHEITVTLPPKPLYVAGDPVRLAQVVGNLLNNACKFTDRGGRIWLTVEEEGDQAVVRVRDTGIGLGADQLGGIFELFAQVDTSLERARDGWASVLPWSRNWWKCTTGQSKLAARASVKGVNSLCACHCYAADRRHRRDSPPASSRWQRFPVAFWSWTTTATRQTAWQCC